MFWEIILLIIIILYLIIVIFAYSVSTPIFIIGPILSTFIIHFIFYILFIPLSFIMFSTIKKKSMKDIKNEIIKEILIDENIILN
jgi:hypothetical protein